MALKSPCTDICRFDRKVDVCVGCFRTQGEVRQWRKMTDNKRRQIIAARPQRQARVDEWSESHHAKATVISGPPGINDIVELVRPRADGGRGSTSTESPPGSSPVLIYGSEEMSMHKQHLRLPLVVALAAGLGLTACSGASSSRAATAGSAVASEASEAPASVAAPSSPAASNASISGSGDAASVAADAAEAAPSRSSAAKDAVPVPLPLLVVTKSPTCGCCHLWVEHMQKAGFRVEIHDVADINLIKERVGVPYGKGSCHTAEVGGYFVEGHVPAEDVKRLLAEKPDAKGLVVPGMPAGSPGMELPDGRVQPYVVELVARDGSTSPFAQHGQ